jgi:DNA mismatch repair protein MutS
MVETAAILNQATDRSLVILDEIGRGTATFDGLSIAWATVEHLHDVNRCRTLFATHYHELTAMASKLESATNVTVAVREWKDNIVFLHEVVKGAADRSYGIQVAKLAGLPQPVIARARQVLARLEKNQGKPNAESLDDLPLFALTGPAAPAQKEPATGANLLTALAEIDPDVMTPREALEALYRLKMLSRGVE